ncbi:hypothetical protein [Helicobacter sp.]|uniref:hypothetical protein n=1 Tax=Helicobacter sp. TaxID=218 RepID=UPI002A91D2BA|nr:hypothetical protein [Helicobacter sp.]MDY5556978.1 hypothetical protein [Helicobacter sp.]
MSGARDEAIHNAVLPLKHISPSLRDSALVESWQSIIKHQVNIIESFKECNIIESHP